MVPPYGKPAWLYTVEFHDAAGNPWRFQPNTVDRRRRVKGSQVEVAYLSSDPQATARKIDGVDGYVHWVVVGVGAAVVIGSLLGFVT